jgi:hypothetical protein
MAERYFVDEFGFVIPDPLLNHSEVDLIGSETKINPFPNEPKSTSSANRRENIPYDSNQRHIRCKLCQTITTFDKFQEHLDKRHGDLIKALNNSNNDNYCPMCKMRLVKTDIYKHLKKVHKIFVKNATTLELLIEEESKYPKAQKQSVKPTALKVTNDRNGDLIKCKFCNAFIKQMRLSSHLYRVHHYSDDALETTLPEIIAKPKPNPIDINPEKVSVFTCVRCNKEVQRSEIIYHVQQEHGNYVVDLANLKTDFCPICEKQLKPDMFVIHLAEQHGMATKNWKSGIQKPSHRRSNRKLKNPLVEPKVIDYQQNIKKQAFEQSFDESEDGGRGLGHTRREIDGKFVSLPLYDEHSGE